MENRSLKPSQLNKLCSPQSFAFTTTAEVNPLAGVIGQDRAMEAIKIGLAIKADGYNMYLSGQPGTGKTTLARDMVSKQAQQEPVPPDWCYVNNFRNPDQPRLLQFAPGGGTMFKQEIKTLVRDVLAAIIKTIESEDFEQQRKQILNSFIETTNQMYLELEQESKEKGFAISRSGNGVNSVPLKDGEPLSQEAYIQMEEAEKAILMKNGALVQEKINAAFRRYKELEKKANNQVQELQTQTAQEVAQPYFDKLYQKYAGNSRVVSYLEDLNRDIIDKWDAFNTPARDDNNSSHMLFDMLDRRVSMRRYQVNVLVDNAELTSAPVIFCTNPTYINLFGQLEYGSEFGVLTTDFTKIKNGALHKANGGYLILNMLDLMKQFNVWDTLKRVLKDGELTLESLSKNMGIINTETVRPEAMPLRVKLIIIGEPVYYQLLYLHDEEFRKLFKIRADFDVEMERTAENIEAYAGFISQACRSNDLLHFSPEATAKIVDFSTRLTESQKKLSTQFNKVIEVIFESDFWARTSGASVVEAIHVSQAVNEKLKRLTLWQEKLQELILDDTIMIDIDGEKIGEVNGLAVYNSGGDYSFGKPVKITAKSFMGEKGLVNIEREIQLSGKIHSKGILTLGGYMGGKYARRKPLALSASLTFEQSYSGVDGDSASSAELYALLSSLAGIPLRQGIAVTGSVNQNGEIQAIGGVNQKIEGFYQICKIKGLTGQQGVIIPQANVDELFLDEEVVQAVKNRQFNLWGITDIDQGLEILSGVAAGTLDEKSEYTAGSFHDRVNQCFKDWQALRQNKKTGTEASPKIRRRRSRRSK